MAQRKKSVVLQFATTGTKQAQRKIPVDLHFLHHRHKAGRAALGLSCVACFEALACVFASSGASIEKLDDTLTKKWLILC